MLVGTDTHCRVYSKKNVKNYGKFCLFQVGTAGKLISDILPNVFILDYVNQHQICYPLCGIRLFLYWLHVEAPFSLPGP